MIEDLENQNLTEQPQPEQPNETNEPTQEIQDESDSKKEFNFRKMREEKEASDRRAYEAERKLLEYEQFLKTQQQQNIQNANRLKDDDFVEGKDYNRLQKELEETKLYTIEMRLKSQYGDFDSVVNEENIRKLAAKKPALYKAIVANENLYDRGCVAYEIISNARLNDNEYPEVDQKLNTNKAKPRSSSAAAPQAQETPLSRMGDYDRRILTEERREQLRREMIEAQRNAR